MEFENCDFGVGELVDEIAHLGKAVIEELRGCDGDNPKQYLKAFEECQSLIVAQEKYDRAYLNHCVD